MTDAPTKVTAGAALVARLGQLGVDYIFANSGTDFPPIIEGLAEAAAKDMALPKAITVPHETAAVAMAHGYALATGQGQAVMVHTNVGLANAAIGAINARADNVPMLLFSGRTPTLEQGRFGARSVPIGWGQEMMDQHALIREAAKWDYELRFPEQVSQTADRAHAIAHSLPKGPTYISLPREVLCETVDAPSGPALMSAASSMARPDDIAQAAKMLAEAKSPVIFAQRGAGSAQAFAALIELAEIWAIPVCQYWALQLAFPTDHPMAADADPAPLLAEADVILVLDALAPWQPDKHGPKEGAKIIQIGQDPLFAQTPVRNFRSDLSLSGDLSSNLLALCEAIKHHAPGDRQTRSDEITARNTESWATKDALIAKDTDGPTLTKRMLSADLASLARTEDATIFGELGAQLPMMRLRNPHSWYESPHSGGLGFGLPAAMGYKLARPDRLVITTMGDGSYMFANPLACHQVAQALGLSILVIVMNNSEWGAVRTSVVDLFPDGFGAKSNTVPLTDLSPSPNFALVAQACGAWSARVDTKAAWNAKLTEAKEHVLANKGLALLDVKVARD
jgi:acetolactate synthase-1/2/3 large subunit